MENVKKFYEALAKDTAMQDRAKVLSDSKPEGEEAVLAAIVDFAAKEGHTLTAEDVKAYYEANAKTELSDDDLDAVAGGAETGEPRCDRISLIITRDFGGISSLCYFRAEPSTGICGAVCNQSRGRCHCWGTPNCVDRRHTAH